MVNLIAYSVFLLVLGFMWGQHKPDDRFYIRSFMAIVLVVTTLSFVGSVPVVLFTPDDNPLFEDMMELQKMGVVTLLVTGVGFVIGLIYRTWVDSALVDSQQE